MNINKEEFVSAVLSDSFGCMEYDAKRLTLNDIDGKIIIKFVTGGASGGSCWGDRATEFTNSREDRIEDATSNFTSVLRYLFDVEYHDRNKYEQIKNLSKEFVEENWDSHYLTTCGSYGDYYGNGTDYEVVGYPLDDVLKFLNAKTLLSDDEVEEIKDLMATEFSKKAEEYNIKAYGQRLEELKNKVKSFESDMKKNMSELERRKVSLKKDLDSVESQIKNFNKTKEKNLESLNKEIEQVEGFLSGKKKTKKIV